MKKLLVPVLIALAFPLAIAKLPALDDAAKAKAAETAAKAAWQGKVDGYLMCKAQDRVVAYYHKNGGAAAAANGKPVSVSAHDAKPVTTSPGGTAASAPASAASAAASAAAKPASAAAPSATAAAAPPPCTDPGPFAYSPPDQKPLETSGAHSPASNATSPPSVNANSASMAPAKKP